MIDEILEDAAERMDKSIASLEAAFARIRTGRAHPSFLDSVDVDYTAVIRRLAKWLISMWKRAEPWSLRHGIARWCR